MEWFLYSWPTLVLLGLALRMALRLNYGARGPELDDPVYILINISSWVLILLGIAPVLLLSGLSVFGIIIVLLALATLIEVVLARRESQRRSMCNLLALVVERGKRFDASVLLSGHSMRGFVGRSMRRLLAAVESGVPLGAAIMRHPRALPHEAVAYVAAGRAIGAEAAALKELAEKDRSDVVAIWRACVDRISYLAAVFLFMVVVLTFMMIKIMPEFRLIFDEFDVELPAMTELAIAVADFSSSHLAAVLLVVLLLWLVLAAVVAVCYLVDFPVLRGLADRVFRQRRSADMMRIVAVATEHRQPLATLFERLAHVYPSTPIRSRLRSVSSLIAAGHDWREALRVNRFISRAEQSLLATAEQVGNLPWVLRTLARRSEKRTVYRLAMVIQVLYPCVILLLGAGVAFFVVAMFVPLVSLIHSLA